MNEYANAKQCLILNDRKNLEIDGVDGIVAFDESYISLATSQGKLYIEGSTLKVDDLSKQNGKIHISGSISAIYYSDTSKRTGVFKIFK